MKPKKSYTWILWIALTVFAVFFVIKHTGWLLGSESAASTPAATAEEEQTQATTVPETTTAPEVSAPTETSTGAIPGSSAKDVMAAFAAVGADSSELKDGNLYISDETKINGEKVQYSIETDQNGAIRCAKFAAYSKDKNGFLWAAAAISYTGAQPDVAKKWVLENEGGNAQTTIGNAVFVLSADKTSRTLIIKAPDYDKWSAQQ